MRMGILIFIAVILIILSMSFSAAESAFLAVNKLDSPDKFLNINDFYSLAIGNPIAISALHGSGGVGDLLDEVTKDFEILPKEEKSENIRIAIVEIGRASCRESKI